MNNCNITAFIIAGGKSSRMGTDKATTFLNNKTFVQHIIDVLKALKIKTQLVSSIKKHEEFDIPIIKDLVENAGPVAGIASALQKTETDINLIISCDVPLIHGEFISWLIQQHKDQFNATIAMVENKKMPLVGIYNKNCKQIMLNSLHNNVLRLQSVLQNLNVNYINTPNDLKHCLFNVNTPEDLKSIN